MNKMDFLNDLNEIDEKLVEEAAPKKAGTGKNGKIIAWAVAAAAVLLTVGLAVWMHAKNGKAPAEAVVLYEDSSVKVSRITERVPGAIQSDEKLVDYTEEELLTRCNVLLRARLTEVTNISVEYNAEHRVTEACVLTLEPVAVLHGDLKKTGPVKVYVDKWINTSLENPDPLEGATVGCEGLLMLYDTNPDSMYAFVPSHVREVADYVTSDNRRFAIWEKDGQLIFNDYSFPGFSNAWTLDQAETYAREVCAGQ